MDCFGCGKEVIGKGLRLIDSVDEVTKRILSLTGEEVICEAGCSEKAVQEEVVLQQVEAYNEKVANLAC